MGIDEYIILHLLLSLVLGLEHVGFSLDLDTKPVKATARYILQRIQKSNHHRLAKFIQQIYFLFTGNEINTVITSVRGQTSKKCMLKGFIDLSGP